MAPSGILHAGCRSGAVLARFLLGAIIGRRVLFGARAAIAGLVFGTGFSHEVVNLLTGFGGHFAYGDGGRVSRFHDTFDQRAEHAAKRGEYFRREDGAGADKDAGDQFGFEKGYTNADGAAGATEGPSRSRPVRSRTCLGLVSVRGFAALTSSADACWHWSPGLMVSGTGFPPA